MNRPLVSIIIPVFNVRKFVGKCCERLFSQSYSNIEFIFIDDCTPDDSMNIIQDKIRSFKQIESKVIIARHEKNKGLPAARNTGLALAKGDFIIHCDSDDFIEPDMVSSMVDYAIKHNSDFVYCDWYLSYENSERIMTEPSAESTDSALRKCLRGEMRYNVWNKLISRRLYTDYNISFPSGESMGEDMTIIKLLAMSKLACHLNKPLYHYVKVNTGSITSNYTESNIIELTNNVKKIESFIMSNKGTGFQKEIIDFKISVKLPLLIGMDVNSYKRWFALFPETNRFSLKTKQSLRIRLIQFCAAKKMYPIIQLHYFIVYRILYTIIFK